MWKLLAMIQHQQTPRGFEPQGPNISPKAFEAATDLSFLKRLEQQILGMMGG